MSQLNGPIHGVRKKMDKNRNRYTTLFKQISNVFHVLQTKFGRNETWQLMTGR